MVKGSLKSTEMTNSDFDWLRTIKSENCMEDCTLYSVPAGKDPVALIVRPVAYLLSPQIWTQPLADGLTDSFHSVILPLAPCT